MTDVQTSVSTSLRGQKVSLLGAVVAALASSACCWIPLLLMAFGLSAGGLSAWFEEYRLIFLIAASTLLGTGFYFAYFRKSACCESNRECATTIGKASRFNRSMLWVATVFIIASAMFPNYVGYLLAAQSSTTKSEIEAPTSIVTLRIEGMTCNGCAAIVKNALLKVPGVRSAIVSYPKGEALLTVDAQPTSKTEDLIAAVERAGFKASEIGNQDKELDAHRDAS